MAVVDRRIQRTRETLHSALMALVVEGPYDTITVQQILDRANIGRSTFYTHFQDKDELLVWGTEHLRQTLSAAQQQLDPSAAKSPESLIRFSRAMFEHADRYRKIYRALVNSAVWPHVRQRIQNIIADLLRREMASMKGQKMRVPLELLIHYIAATLMTVMTWWVDHRSSLSVEEIDEVYRSLVVPAIRSNLA
jgi:AcrR family transcriptional regulator